MDRMLAAQGLLLRGAPGPARIYRRRFRITKRRGAHSSSDLRMAPSPSFLPLNLLPQTKLRVKPDEPMVIQFP